MKSKLRKLAVLLFATALVPMANAGALRAVGKASAKASKKVSKPIYHGMEKAGHGVKVAAVKTSKVVV